MLQPVVEQGSWQIIAHLISSGADCQSTSEMIPPALDVAGSLGNEKLDSLVYGLQKADIDAHMRDGESFWWLKAQGWKTLSRPAIASLLEATSASHYLEHSVSASFIDALSCKERQYS